MKVRVLAILLLLPCLLFAQQKQALLVAVGNYPMGAGLPPIAAVNDLPYLKTVLTRNGFPEKNIVTLVNAKATKDAILKSLDALAARTKKNDIIVVSFGCHGQQIRDQRTIELGKDEDDGYDEALLPYDAKGRYNPTGYRGEKHLRDDDLYPKLLAIRKKAGPGGSVLVLLDACHSGTGTRAETFAGVRGDPVPFPDPENPVDSVITVANRDTRPGFFDADADSLSNMIVLSGSAPYQENKQLVIDHTELGSLSYAFYKAMNELPKGSTYGLLFEKIKATIQALVPDQVPVLEGNPSQVVLSGKYTAEPERVFIRVGTKLNPAPADTVFIIPRGKMDYYRPGMTCKIFEAGKPSVVATALVRKVENFSSIGIASAPLKKETLYELKPDEEPMSAFTAGLKLTNTSGTVEQLTTQVKKMVQPLRFITLADDADFELNIAPAGVRLTDRNRNLLWSIQMPADSFSTADQSAILATIRSAMRVKFLRALEDGGDLAAMIEVSIVPEKGTEPLVEGDKYTLRIRNNSAVKLFYTVLDIYPDNRVEILYPFKGKEPADYQADKQATVLRKLSVSTGTPLGREFLKVIVSREPLDLRSVVEQTVRRDEMGSFQRMLDDLFNDTNPESATRADISSIKAEEVGIRTVSFRVEKK